MSGPLPTGTARRRNAPSIPTTKLPAEGRKGRAPTPPYQLGDAGASWWRWAWALPQAAAWSKGDLYALARRASLEDDMAALADVKGLDFDDLGERADEVGATVRRVAALATGRLQLCKEARELDDRFGLTAKGLAALRWTIVASEKGGDERGERGRAQPERTRRLRAVDTAVS